MPFRRFFQSKISRMLFATFVILAIPLIVINFVITSRGIQLMRAQISGAYRNSLALIADQFQDRLKDLEMMAASMTIDDALNAMCIAEKGEENLLEYVQFQSRMRGYVNQRILKGNISVILPKQGWVISTLNGIDRTEVYADFDTYWENIGDYGTWRIRRSLKDKEEDCFSTVVGYVNQNQTNAVFVIEIEKDQVLEALSDIRTDRTMDEVFLMDAEGKIYGQDSGRYQDEDLVQAIHLANWGQEEASGDLTYRMDGRMYRVLCEPVAGGDVIGMMIDEESILRPVYATRWWAYAAVGVFFCVSLLYTFFTYRRITQPVGSLQAAMRRVESGDFTARACAHYQNELSDVTVSFNQMVERMDEMIHERYARELQMKQTQLRFLRAQINPHFLYNCLFTLYTLIKNEDLDSAADMAIYLGQYYQINTRAGDGAIPLYQDLEHVRLLIKIHNMRFQNLLSYEEEVDDALKMFKIPNLAIMTLAENSITHGLKSIHEPSLFKVQAAFEGEDVVIRVLDSGLGASDERLEEMRGALKSASVDQADARGLQNIQLRFQMLYGEETYMSVDHNTPHGLIVTLRIPKWEADGHV